MAVAFCNYVRFKDTEGQYLSYNFQNFFVGENPSRQGVTYFFAPFAVTPGAGTKGGDRSDSAIVAPVDQLVANLFREACEQSWLCEITVVLLDPESFSEVFQVTTETWTCSRPEVTTERIVLRLASPLDAVDSQIPRRTLSSRLVGSLPSSGSLSAA